MDDLIWLVPALPLLGFVLLALLGRRIPRWLVAALGVGSVAGSALMALAVAGSFLGSPPPGGSARVLLWQWMSLATFRPAVALHLDPLSLVMMLVVTVVGALIHLYSAEFMAEEEGYSRFFAEMNLFVGAMLILVLADDLLLLYLGWEGVGLCSFLLIGFWYNDPQNVRAARKAFLVTRIGDVAMLLGLLLLLTRFGTLEIAELLRRADAGFRVGEPAALLAAALLLGGAVGKSAQLPLQTWLPDAMAGPTPVSALIHAATMVTAGVYLIARTHVLFELAPPVMTAVGAIGATTLLLAGFSALAQRDIKRALAYSTISQIGYMFLALGVGAWSAAIFHLATHAAFKALLFLGAGSISVALHHEHDLFRMGGLRRLLPVTFWTFLVGAASLAGLPLVTAGFYSKEAILFSTWSGSAWLWAAGVAGTLITGLYAFRLVFLAFFGEPRTPVTRSPGWTMKAPLVALAALALTLGFVEPPPAIFHLSLFSRLLEPVFFAAPTPHASRAVELGLLAAASVASLLGVLLAFFAVQRRRAPAADAELAPGRLPGVPPALHELWFLGWRFDQAYQGLVRPLRALGRALRGEPVDHFYRGIAGLVQLGHRLLRRTQAGQLRWYAAGIVLGAILLLALVVLR